MKRLFLPTVLSLCALFLAGCGSNLLDYASTGRISCCVVIILVLDAVALVEVFGSDRSLAHKALWGAFIFFCPVLGIVVYYLFGRGK